MSNPPQPPSPQDPQGAQNPQGSQDPQGQQYSAHPEGAQPQYAAPGTGAGQRPEGTEAPKSGMGKGPILAIVGCVALFLVLLLALGAFFGIRALTGGDDSTPGEQTTAPQKQTPTEDATEPAEETTEARTTTAKETPSEEATTSADPSETESEAVAGGEANAVPKGTAVTLPDSDYQPTGTVDTVIGDVNWDATAWVAEQNKFNEVPPEGQKYIMVQAELTYHGPDEWSTYAWPPADFVDADGNAYEDAGVVTPDTIDKPTLTDGGTVTRHWVYLVPADTPEGGHFVLANRLPLDEALVEGQWVEAT